jgi:hypothetical protein
MKSTSPDPTKRNKAKNAWILGVWRAYSLKINRRRKIEDLLYIVRVIEKHID